MIKKQRRSVAFLGGTVALFCVAAIILYAQTGSLVGLFLTPDQQAQRLVDRGQYKEAAARFTDPMRQGAALYSGRDYKRASQAFARLNTPEGHFNRGNALVMLGKYEDAVKAYDRSLQLRPDWSPAMKNREIALVRGERTKDKGGEMTGGKLGADDVVIEPGKGKSRSGQTEVTTGGKQLSDKELQAMWLRRVETRPSDFLRAKFAFQFAQPAGHAETREKQ
jgi:Ca-activated chloride channel homolog